MSRVFTVSIPFKGRLCSAIVSYQDQSNNPDFLIRYTDEDLRTLIPDGRLTIRLAEEGSSHKELTGLAEMLICQTTKAITMHLHSKEK